MIEFTDREARLAPTLLNVLVAGMCDPSRLSRGRTYSRQGAVMDVRVEPGQLTGFVQGSSHIPYEVVAHVSLVAEVNAINELVPTARELRFDCSCPDWESPCKHAVAVMIEFSDRVGGDLHLLATWRGVVADTTQPRAIVGSRAQRSTVAAGPAVGRSAGRAAAPAVSVETRAALDDYLGTGTDHEFRRAEISTLASPQSDGWNDVWVTMLDDALGLLHDLDEANDLEDLDGFDDSDRFDDR